MAIESDIVPPGTGYIDALDSSNPDGAVSEVREMDNHLRGIKNVILRTFANITGAVTATHTEINKLTGLAGDVITTTSTSELTNKTITDGVANTQTSGDDSTKVATTAYVDAKMVMLDTPISVALTSTWHTVSDTTLASAGAKFAIVAVQLTYSVTAGIGVPSVGLRRTGSGFAINTNGTTLDTTIFAGTSTGLNLGAQGLVKLDANQDFDAHADCVGGSVTARNAFILGYYV